MRVLLVVHHLPPRHVAGTEVYTARLASVLARRHDVTVLATDDDPRLPEGSVRERWEGPVRIVEIAEPRVVREPSDSWFSGSAESAFASLVAAWKPDVCHFQHLRFLSMRLPEIARGLGVPSLMTVHDYWLLCARDGQLVDREGALCSGPGAEKCAACLAGFPFGLSPKEAWASRLLARFEDGFRVDLRGAARRAGLAFRRASRKSRPPKGLPPQDAAGMLALVESRRAAAGAVPTGVDTFIAPSKFLRGVFEDADFARGRWVVVGHGVDRPPARRPAEDAGGTVPLRIGFAGTITPPKGVDVLIRAVKQLSEGSWRLDVCGRDDLRPEFAAPLKREARGLPIRFSGAYAPSEGPALMRDWDVAVVPSRWVENQPLAILEAFASGIPVVASDLGGMRELVTDGVNGRLFETGSATALAGVLGELAGDRLRLAALGRGIVPPPTLEEHVERIEDLYAEAIG